MTAAQRAMIAAWLARARTVIADFIRPEPVPPVEAEPIPAEVA